MNTHVTQMVELLFQNVQTSEEVQALHDEVMNNCQERYQDLISHGISEEEATAAVMESLKGMDEVLREYPQREKTPEANTDEAMDPEIADAAEERMTFSPEEMKETGLSLEQAKSAYTAGRLDYYEEVNNNAESEVRTIPLSEGTQGNVSQSAGEQSQGMAAGPKQYHT